VSGRSSMKIFDDIPRVDYLPSSHSEPAFAYINRSSREELVIARALLQAWFDRYPEKHQRELWGRIRSPINRDHNAAVFELALHQLLLLLGGEIIIHPTVPGSPRRPDFLVRDSDGHQSYVEAALVTFRSADAEAAEARKNAVYDVLNRTINAPHWFLWLEIQGAPSSQPPARDIARFLTEKLRLADAAAIAAAYEASGLEGLPSWPFSHEGWSIVFRPIPRRPGLHDDPHHRPLGMFSTPVTFVDHRTQLRDSILEKASSYGGLEYPFIVAVHPLEDVDSIDVADALFGKERYLISIPELHTDAQPQVTPSRVTDGVWTNPTGPRNRQLSAVLFAKTVFVWAIHASSACLYHNPWASIPYGSILCSLPQAIPKDGQLRMVDGIDLGELLAGSIC
jgi:hypothetical protein